MFFLTLFVFASIHFLTYLSSLLTYLTGTMIKGHRVTIFLIYIDTDKGQYELLNSIGIMSVITVIYGLYKLMIYLLKPEKK